jgi:8-oxo-dGTP pyrophosphatase MutT (NUDIX family)
MGQRRERLVGQQKGPVITMLPASVFGANTVIVLINGGRKLLALACSEMLGAWQLRQVGVGEDEEPIEASRRELEEETGGRRRCHNSSRSSQIGLSVSSRSESDLEEPDRPRYRSGSCPSSSAR